MNPNNIVQYDGTCEITHLEDFKYNEKILETLNLDLDDNKKITATDLSTINNTILKNIELTYDKSFDRKTNE